MDRREFLKSLGLLPFIGLPELPEIELKEIPKSIDPAIPQELYQSQNLEDLYIFGDHSHWSDLAFSHKNIQMTLAGLLPGQARQSAETNLIGGHYRVLSRFAFYGMPLAWDLIEFYWLPRTSMPQSLAFYSAKDSAYLESLALCHFLGVAACEGDSQFQVAQFVTNLFRS